MAELETKRETEEAEELERVLPLVIEIMPGQANEGLVDIYEPGSYDGKTLRELCEQSLQRDDLSIEDRQILWEIKRQLDGGKLLSRGKEIDLNVMSYAVAEETEAGERYFYVAIRAIKPQEGGLCPAAR